MKDIATLAGVSRQAVSSVLNGNNSCRISKAKSEEIKRVARELNYVSNNAARCLKGAPTHTIGIMGPISDGSGVSSALIGEISQILMARGYNVLYNNYTWSNHNSTESLLQLVARGVDGIIIYNYDRIEIFEANQAVPYLFFANNNDKHADVGIDDEYGGYLATKHLLDHGHRKIAALMIRDTSKRKGRYSGWLRAQLEAGINVSESDAIILRDLKNGGQEMIDIIKKKKITAVFAFNDFIGAKLIKILKRNGINVPQDIAVIGYDGLTFSEYCSPSLTTIIQPIRPQAEFGVELLLERIKKKELHSTPAKHLIAPILHQGESCGCPSNEENDFFQLRPYDTLEKNSRINFNIDILTSNSSPLLSPKNRSANGQQNAQKYYEKD